MKIKKIKLWVVFLPLSVIVMIIYRQVRLHRLGLGKSSKNKKQNNLCVLLGGFGVVILSSIVLTNLLYNILTDPPIFLLYLCDYISHILGSLVVREIEYRQLLDIAE